MNNNGNLNEIMPKFVLLLPTKLYRSILHPSLCLKMINHLMSVETHIWIKYRYPKHHLNYLQDPKNKMSNLQSIA